MKLIRAILIGILLVTTGNMWAGDTYYAKVNVSAESGKGKVYASAESAAPADDAYQESMSVSNKASSQSVTFNLWAKPAEGMVFSHWEKGGVATTDPANCQITISSSSKDENAPVEASYVAKFIERPALVLNIINSGLGTATISKRENRIGDEVTLTASLKKEPRYGCRHLMSEFIGWQNADGEIISKDLTYTFRIEKEDEITAVFGDRNALKQSGYFRVRNIFNRVLTIVGNYKYQSVGLSGNYLDGLLHWSCPDDFNTKDFADKYWNGSDEGTKESLGVDVESLASGVIYIKGESLNADAGSNEDAITKVNAFGQGTDTKTMTGQTLTVKGASVPGYYILYGAANAGLKMTHREGDEDRDGDGVNDGHWAYCSPLLGNCKYDDPYSWMAIQPLDEEHIDEFWFGASADESMCFDGGYWTSMYTSFPYECRDGVEAYYACETVTLDGITYIQLRKVGTVVPPETPVLLKCQGLRSRQNRLLPLDPDAEYSAVEGNLLVGLYQLWTDKDGNGREVFDETRMRVFGTDSNGNLGFYKLAAGTELKANKVYLDMSKLTVPASGSMRIMIDNEDAAGIENVIGAETRQNDNAIYDLLGRRVTNPLPGTIYIRSGKKFVLK